MVMFRVDASRTVRITFGVMVAAIAIIVAPAEAAVNHRKHLVHFHRTYASVQIARASVPQAATLSPMRYYGGPKSSMWREVR